MSQSVITQVIDILCKIQPLEDFKADTLLFDSGRIDSMIVFERLLPALEERFQITVEPPELVPENFETPEAIGTYVESKRLGTG